MYFRPRGLRVIRLYSFPKCGFKLMWCGSCQKRPGPTCSCCRTLERIGWIVRDPRGLPDFATPRTLAILRETAGCLQDLFDEVHSLPSTPRAQGGVSAPPGVETPVASGAAGSLNPGTSGGSPPEKGAGEPPESRVARGASPREVPRSPGRAEGGERLLEAHPKSRPGKGPREEKRKKRKKDRKEAKKDTKEKSRDTRSPLPRNHEPERGGGSEEPVAAETPGVEPLRVHGSAGRHFERRAHSEERREADQGHHHRAPRSPSRSPQHKDRQPPRKHRGSKGQAHRERGRLWREGQWRK